MKRLKKDLEAMLATTIDMTFQGTLVVSVPLEFFYHWQKFLNMPIPSDFPSNLVKRPSNSPK